MLEQKMQEWAQVPHAIKVAWNYQAQYIQWRLRAIQIVLGITGFFTSVWAMYTFWGYNAFGAYLFGLFVAAMWFLLYIAILFWLHARETREWEYMRRVTVKEADDMMARIPFNALPTESLVPRPDRPRPLVLRAWDYLREEQSTRQDDMDDEDYLDYELGRAAGTRETY